ncbi:hypothetical protein [Szabonella alba]|uniref:Uncharacterized protein n=1 Tax=Szabonella alba TaxID=2804194 RepID=A0A8K0VD13_9RHOB|nr:hypothetical protein [Szabonella alba]MBL4919421.1 hypothetical protein [Szabonella alba]
MIGLPIVLFRYVVFAEGTTGREPFRATHSAPTACQVRVSIDGIAEGQTNEQ